MYFLRVISKAEIMISLYMDKSSCSTGTFFFFWNACGQQSELVT